VKPSKLVRIVLGVVSIIVISCGSEKLNTLTLTIDEMGSPACQLAVQNTILQADGIKELSLNYQSHKVVVTLRPEKLSGDGLRQLLWHAGYTVDGVPGDSTAHSALPLPCKP